MLLWLWCCGGCVFDVVVVVVVVVVVIVVVVVAVVVLWLLLDTSHVCAARLTVGRSGQDVQVIVRDASNSSRVAQGLGTGSGNSSCYVGPSWTDTGMQAVEVAVVCGGNASCAVLLDFRTTCSAGRKGQGRAGQSRAGQGRVGHCSTGRC